MAYFSNIFVYTNEKNVGMQGSSVNYFKTPIKWKHFNAELKFWKETMLTEELDIFTKKSHEFST